MGGKVSYRIWPCAAFPAAEAAAHCPAAGGWMGGWLGGVAQGVLVLFPLATAGFRERRQGREKKKDTGRDRDLRLDPTLRRGGGSSGGRSWFLTAGKFLFFSLVISVYL